MTNLDPLEDGRPPVTHEQALNSARRFIDEHFNNEPKYGRVKTCIPAQPDDDDILLTTYVKQQEARAARERELETVLRKLANEASGFLSMASIGNHGVTNIRVMERRIAEARAALSETQPEPQEKT